MRLTSPLLCAAVLALAACHSTARKAEETTFQPTADGFVFRARAYDSGVLGVDNPTAEAERLRWLAEYTKDNGVCPAGYAITARHPVLKERVLGTGVMDVFYEGRCKS